MNHDEKHPTVFRFSNMNVLQRYSKHLHVPAMRMTTMAKNSKKPIPINVYLIFCRPGFNIPKVQRSQVQTCLMLPYCSSDRNLQYGHLPAPNMLVSISYSGTKKELWPSYPNNLSILTVTFCHTNQQTVSRLLPARYTPGKIDMASKNDFLFNGWFLGSRR